MSIGRDFFEEIKSEEHGRSKPEVIAGLIKRLTGEEVVQLRQLLEDWGGGDETGVTAVLPPHLPLKEGAAEVDLPEDYWETAQ